MMFNYKCWGTEHKNMSKKITLFFLIILLINVCKIFNKEIEWDKLISDSNDGPFDRLKASFAGNIQHVSTN